MAEILKEWLTERLLMPIKWEAEDFGELMKDGHVIAGVLLSYHVINEEKHFLIRSSKSPLEIHANWKYLVDWLREVDVYLSEADLSSIMEGKGSALLRLFYQLFLHLDKRDRTDFIKRERQMVSSLVDKLDKRFTVRKVEEDVMAEVDHLSKPLLNERHLIEWQKKKAEEVKETYDFVRYKFSKMLERIAEAQMTSICTKAPTQAKLPPKDRKDIEEFCLRYPCKYQNYTYEQLLNLEETSADRRRSLVDSEWAKKYVENLHTRLCKKKDSEEFQKQMRSVLSGSLWDISMMGEESKADADYAKKVMKFSQFEKQMCTSIIETKQQARNLIMNRVRAEKEFAEQRDLQFHQYLDNVKEQIRLEVVEIDFEKQRQDRLHKKLYEEKMARKRAHWYEICYDTMLSIVDYATRYAYFKRLIGDDIPEHFVHEWKILFLRKQPIFDILDPMEDLLKQVGPEEQYEPEEEEIRRLELDRQDALNDNEFIEYHNYLHPWNLDLLIPNYDPESEERKYEYLGTRILGHVVYTLLEMKYPYPPPRLPADLPHFASKALLRGLPDRAICVPMQTLLNLHNIFVCRPEAAIYHCLRRFKSEMLGIEDISLTFDKYINSVPDAAKDMAKNLKSEDEIYSRSSQAMDIASLGPIPPNCKNTQTPNVLPEIENKLTVAADLGKYAYEAINFGDTLTDHLLCAMIVEYLKAQENINGFVIINYPNSYREAQILEETFSGIEPPFEGDLDDRDEIYLEESIVKHRKKEKDPFKEKRISRLVTDPHQKNIEKPFESYFTCYIKLKASSNILRELVIWDLTEENSELIDRVYAVLGLNYSMYYEVFEKDFLSQICKYIIGDLTMPLKSSTTLFGEHMLSALEFLSSEDKRTKTRIVKPEAKLTKMQEKFKRDSKSLTKMESALESTELLPEDVMDEAQKNSEPEEAEEEVKILAGEEEWEYGQLPIAENIGIALATCWEEIERTYIHDMEQLFFSKRLQMNCLVPFCRFIKDKMEQIITLPSQKQDLVSRFQQQYNEFEDDWREINVTKNEWHCRVKELQHKLYTICDERKLFAEQQRQALITENWAMEELTVMVNTYISCMQAELNRFFLTCQTLHDFFFSMIKKLPPTDRNVSVELTTISRLSDDLIGGKQVEDKVFRQIKLSYLELQLKDIEIDFDNNPFNMVLQDNVNQALKIINETNDQYRSLISREYTEIAKVVTTIKKKDDKDESETDSVNLEELFRQNGLKCIDEWIMGVNGEMYRASLRMLILQYKCYHDMKLFSDQIFKTYMEVQNQINQYYSNEIQSIDRLCKYIQMAVEGAKKIPEALILDQDKFIIDPNLLQFATPEPPADTGIVAELTDELEFKIGQLARLRTQFKIVAPTGLALQQAFIYLIQDFIFFGKESCEGSLFPDCWKRIDPEQVNKLVFRLYGETAYVDWRDFLIYCLNIRFPAVEELLELRKQFRCKDLKSTELISREDFLNIPLWFETDFDPEDRYAQLRKTLIKHFLFELFEVAENMTNYSALLLALCKNVNAHEGFAAALSMAVGKKTCISREDCMDYVCKLIRDKQYKDDCLACARNCAITFLEALFNNVIDTCEGTTIIEIPYEAPVGDKKGKKGGKGGKSGKEALSSRLPEKKNKPETKKKSVSADDVKKIFICPPCEPTPAEEATTREKEEVEEEEKPEPQGDPDLCYALPQDVIWKVLKICLPWHFDLVPEVRMTPYIEQIKDVMKRLEVLTENGDIYVIMLLADPAVCKIINKVRKFTALNLVQEVKAISEF